MDEALVDNWNSVINKNDTVYYLGDLFFNDNSNIDYIKKLVSSLNGHKHFIKGNHDKLYNKVSQYFIDFKIEDFVTVEGQLIHLYHYPVYEWEGFYRGSWHCYGHCHSNVKLEGKAWDVGVDNNNYFPVSFDQLSKIMKYKE